jgi:hypothetical protein
VLGTGLIYYFKKGAFQEPELKVTEAPAYTIAGVPFKGKATSKEFGKLFNEADKVVEQKKLNGTVCGIFYNNPEEASDEIDAFVGIIISDTTQSLPENYSKRSLPARKVIEARIDNIYGSPLIYPKIEDYAEEHHIQSKQVPALEIYPATKEVIVQVPVK